MQAEQSCALWRATSPVGRTPRAARRAAPGTGRSGTAAYIQERSERQSPLTRGMGGGKNQRHGQRAAAPVLSLCAPCGGSDPKRWGLPGGDTVSAAVQTSPPTAARPPRVLPPGPTRQRSRASDHCPAWKGSRTPWYAYLHTAGRGLSGPCGVHGARHAWCGIARPGLCALPIQMARELGLNPKQCGGLANHRQEPWKLPLPECIAECYRKRLHRERPVKVVPLAEAAKRHQQSARDKARHPRERTDT
jgi:hypothetical protein